MAHARLVKASKEGAQDWDTRYETITTIPDEPPLYLAGGYSSDGDFIEQVVHEDRATVYRNMRVAKWARSADIELYGASKLDLAITLLEAEQGSPLTRGAPLDFARLRVTFKDGAKSVVRAFGECSAISLRAAIALARGKDATSPKATPEARAVGAAINKSGVKGVTFSVSKGHLSACVALPDVVKVAQALCGLVLEG